MQIFIKDQNKWEKDDNHKKINKTIRKITRIQAYKLKEWESEHPNYMEMLFIINGRE